MKQHSFGNLIIPVLNFLILFGSMLSAYQLRLLIPYGHELVDYQSQFLAQIVIFITSIILTTLAANLLTSLTDEKWLTPRRQYRLLLVELGLVCALILKFLPDVSELQLLYFGVGVVSLGAFTIVYPGRLRRNAYYHTNTIYQDLIALYKARSSIFVWLKYIIMARYAQTVLGILWVMLEPLMMSATMAIAFTYLIGRVTTDVPFFIFLLSGLTIFGIFRKPVAKSPVTLLAKGNIIKQLYFPREIIIVLDMGQSLIDSVFSILILIFLGIFYGIYPNIYYLFIPLPLFFLVCLSMGISFFISWFGLLARDLQQITGVVLQLLFYITVLYGGNASGQLAYIIELNPLIGIVQFFRDIVIYEQMPDFTGLFLSGTISLTILYVGYVFFKVHEDRFADYV